MKRYVTKKDYSRVLADVVMECYVSCSIRVIPFLIVFVGQNGDTLLALHLNDAKIVLSAIEDRARRWPSYRKLASELEGFIREEESTSIVF